MQCNKEMFLLLIVLGVNMVTFVYNVTDLHDSGNCLLKAHIMRLKKAGRCASSSHTESKELQWEQCVKRLSKKVRKHCGGLDISMVRFV